MKQYENDPDFKEFEFMANTGCCAICSALNRQRFKITDRHPGENFPPLHPWCRCTFVPVLIKKPKSDIIHTFEEYAENPSLLGESTPAEKYIAYCEGEYDVRPLGKGSQKGVPFLSGGGYRIFFDEGMSNMLSYHPKQGSHHSGEYYKLSGGNYGIKRFHIDGTEKED